jgi:hypothetical protein
LSAFAGRAHVAAMSLRAGDYRPHYAEHPVLYRVIDEHLDAFLETARRHADGASLPAFVEQEFRDFLTCGVRAHGFARVRCTECALERLVPFSCKATDTSRSAPRHWAWAALMRCLSRRAASNFG